MRTCAEHMRAHHRHTHVTASSSSTKTTTVTTTTAMTRQPPEKHDCHNHDTASQRKIRHNTKGMGGVGAEKWGSRRNVSQAPGTFFFFLFFSFTILIVNSVYSYEYDRHHHITTRKKMSQRQRYRAQMMRIASFGPLVSKFFYYLCCF